MGSEQAALCRSGDVLSIPVSDRKTILFVDDDLVLLEMRRLIFQSLGYTVMIARSEDAALKLLRRNRIDAVVIEHMLPGTDGVQTANRIRSLDAGLPIISSSGCNGLPESLLGVVNAAVPKGEGPEALIEVLYQQVWEPNAS